jgi:hypothetical protein
VIVPVRDVPGLAVAVNRTCASPLPLVAEAIVIHAAPGVTVQPHPAVV